MVIACFAYVGRAQQTNRVLSNADKNEIVTSTLRMAFGTPGLIPRTLSTESIEFVDASQMSKMGLVLAGPGQGRDAERNRFADHVVFKRIASNDGVVSVVLWQITELFICDCWHGPNSSCGVVSKKHIYNFTFEFNKETGEWIGQRVYKPMPQFEGSNKLFKE
jgi:hypothetical protein